MAFQKRKVGFLVALGAASVFFFHIPRFPFPARILSHITKNAGETRTHTQELLPPHKLRVPILVYHSIRPYYAGETPFVKGFDVPPDVFEEELRYLKEKGYATISFDALADALTKDGQLPEKSVILTFDDGWENQYIYGLPLLKKYGYAGTFFVFTNAIGHTHYLTWDEIHTLAREGFTIGDHTKSHPLLFKIEDKEKLRDEIIGSKKILEAHLGKEITIFATPFGKTNDAITQVAKEAGFHAVRTLRGGLDHSPEDLFALHAFQASNDFRRFVEELNGF